MRRELIICDRCSNEVKGTPSRVSIDKPTSGASPDTRGYDVCGQCADDVADSITLGAIVAHP